MSISARIFSLLKEKGRSQGELSDVLGIRQATVSSWKTKGTSPSSDLLAKIADFLGVSVDYIVTGKEYTPSQTINQGVVGNGNIKNAVTINGNDAIGLSDFEKELLRIYAALDVRDKNALLTYAYNLEKGISEVK